jgi:hypothetical protein
LFACWAPMRGVLCTDVLDFRLLPLTEPETGGKPPETGQETGGKPPDTYAADVPVPLPVLSQEPSQSFGAPGTCQMSLRDHQITLATSPLHSALATHASAPREWTQVHQLVNLACAFITETWTKWRFCCFPCQNTACTAACRSLVVPCQTMLRLGWVLHILYTLYTVHVLHILHIHNVYTTYTLYREKSHVYTNICILYIYVCVCIYHIHIYIYIYNMPYLPIYNICHMYHIYHLWYVL